MNGVHDMGGVAGFGPVAPDTDGPIFHADWERDVLAMTLAMGARGLWNLDESRSARESIPPKDYLSIGYYRIWLQALERLLEKYRICSAKELAQFMESGLVTDATVDCPKPVLTADRVSAALAAGSPVTRKPVVPASFHVGQPVRVKLATHTGHTRSPQYIQGHLGEIYSVHGAHVFADSHACGAGENPQWLYNVRFSATELWGEGQSSARWIHVDCWEPYLESHQELNG